MRYLLVTFIPYAQKADGRVLLDRLWAEDLKGLANSIGEPISIAAPLVDAAQLQAWNTGFEELNADASLRFIPLPARRGRLDATYVMRLRSALRKAVNDADIVHSSNVFEPNEGLLYAHHYANKRGVKTLFVIAEDFYDMLSWEWVRTAPGAIQRIHRQTTLDRTDKLIRKAARNSSLTFLHTPAAVSRYRLDANHAIAIRQPMHERDDVIAEQALEARLTSTGPLRIVTASRLKPLKGLDLLVRALGILKTRGVDVRATLYGDGPQHAELEALVLELGLEETVQLAGSVSPAAALREKLNQTDVFVMPHLTNDFGRAFFDGQAAGMPVVAFRSTASQDTVRDGVDGLLVPNADAEALASALARLHQDRVLLGDLSRAARTHALENTRTVWNALRAGWVRELFPR